MEFKLRSFREEKGYTQSDLAKLVGKSLRTVRMWVLIRYLTLGQTFKFFDFQDEPTRNAIARSFSDLYSETHETGIKIHDRDLRLAYDHIKDFRNICAHDERLYCARVSPSKDVSISGVIADFAVKRDLLQSNAFSISYDLPKKAGGRSKAILTLEEADALFGELRGSVVEAPFIAACFGSCRTGESLGIRVDEVERVDAHGVALAVARVERQMPNSGYEPTEILKTDSSRRVIVIPGRWGERFLEIADERRAVGSEWMADRCDGLPLNKVALGYHWRKLAPDDVPFSNLRNSWRTFAQANWRIDYDLLETLMGHRLEGVTGRHYLRFTREQIIEQFAREYSEAMSS